MVQFKKAPVTIYPEEVPRDLIMKQQYKDMADVVAEERKRQKEERIKAAFEAQNQRPEETKKEE